MKVRVGYGLGNIRPLDGERLGALAEGMERRGFDSLWLSERISGPAPDPVLGLTYAAARTKKIKLGTSVSVLPGRSPALVAKEWATLDVLSGGRAQLGIGAAWYEREHRALGVPFPPVAERFERLEETLQICGQMWSDDDGPFNGTHYQLAETICRPRPIQQPRPRILVGGSGERKTLRLVAKYADACNLIAADPDVVKRKLEVLREHCDAEGRDPAEIQKTILARGATDPLGAPEAFLQTMETYAAMGVDLVEIVPAGPDPAGFVGDVCEKLLPRLAEIG
jgi:F420-dependent oxidoreductase-like protein